MTLAQGQTTPFENKLTHFKDNCKKFFYSLTGENRKIIYNRTKMNKRLTIFFLLCLILLSTCSPMATKKAIQPTSTIQTNLHSNESIPSKYRGKLKLFVLMGQSNMSGRGEVPADLKHTNPRVYMFGNDYRWKLAEEPVDSAKGQIDMVSEDRDAGISPSLSFAETLLESKPEWVIGLIPCAKNSTSLIDWAQNDDPKSLYGSCLKRVKQAAEMGTVEGILFYQGETDANDPNYYRSIKVNKNILPANHWAEAFEDFVRAWRRDLGISDLPVVFAQLATTTDKNLINWEIIKEQQASVNMLNVAMVKTDDLGLGDAVHLNVESYLEVGRRFAKAYLQIIQ